MVPAQFSASGFLADIRRYGATYMNYVGKPLAYILATAEQSDDEIVGLLDLSEEFVTLNRQIEKKTASLRGRLRASSPEDTRRSGLPARRSRSGAFCSSCRQ